MARRPRIHLPGGFYHVILRGNGRKAIFFDHEDRMQWQDFLLDGLVRYGHRLHAYCWMTNYVHMLIQVGAEPLAGIMRFLASQYARYINRKRNSPGHLFERRYRAILVQANEYLTELLRYIHQNPVRARIVTDPSDYEWSSHHAYMQLDNTDWLTVEYLAAMFGAEAKSARIAYANFMTNQPSDATIHLLRNGTPNDDRALGHDEWMNSVLNRPIAATPFETLDDVVTDACQRHNVTEAMLGCQSRCQRHSSIRAEIAIAATEQGLATVTEVARRFGRAHSGLSRAMNRLRDQTRK